MEQEAKSEFGAAYGAGRQAVEKLGQRFYWMLAVAIILTRVIEKWIIAKYSLSSLQGFLLSVGGVTLVLALFVFVPRRSSSTSSIRGKDN
jgi:hypothetical protein